MSIVIEKEHCIGCGRCAGVCPGSLIKMDDDRKAYIRYPKNCWGCASCIKECRAQAISLYLGADVGGRGSRLKVREKEDVLCWIIEKADGTKESILVNKKESNQY